MTLFTAKLLSPVQTRQDWDQPRLGYMPRRLYNRRFSRIFDSLGQLIR